MQTRQELEGLNYLLHGATVLGLELDPPSHVATISLQVTTLPKTGQLLIRSNLRLTHVSALVVNVQDHEGEPPSRNKGRFQLDRLSEVASAGHPLTGFDFIDSESNSEPRGSLVFEWFEPGLSSDHALNFYHGMETAEDEPELLLFFRIFFDTASLTYPDGHEFPINAFAPSQDSLGRAIALGDPSPQAPIRVFPDPVSPSSVDGELLALVFVNSDHLIRGYAVGQARWDGRRMRWLSPDGVLYDLPDASAKAIRPRFSEMGMGFERMDGFSYFVLLLGPFDTVDTRAWVAKTLKPSRRWRSFLDRRR